jgi:hypothetical protein
VLQLKSPWRDGTTHIVMSALELMQRLAALVPRPRLHLIRFHGVLAPHAKLRAQIVPSAPLNAHEACDHHAQSPPPSAPARMSWACLLKRVFDIDIECWLNCGGASKIIPAIVDPTVIAKILTTCTYPPAHRPDHRRGESICSKPPDRTLKLPFHPAQPRSRRSRSPRHSRKRQNGADMGRLNPMNGPENPATWQLFTNNPRD